MNVLMIFYAIMGAALIAYVVSGGADFGAGFWDLLSGKREKHRSLIDKSIAPIWEANHVWLIFMIVILFTVFPKAFSRISINAHIPISIALVGVVLRGSAFTFRSYGFSGRRERRVWDLLFGFSSVLTPLCFGSILGALSSGDMLPYKRGQRFFDVFVAPYIESHSLAVGVYTCIAFALLASVYLARDAQKSSELGSAQDSIVDTFRKRALFCEVLCGLCALWVLWSAKENAPYLFEGLLTPWALAVEALTACAAFATMYALYSQRLAFARYGVVVQVGLVVLGFGVAMRGAIVVPDLTWTTAGPDALLYGPMLWAVGIGMVVLIPALWILYRVFKHGKPEGLKDV